MGKGNEEEEIMMIMSTTQVQVEEVSLDLHIDKTCSSQGRTDVPT